LSAFTRIFEGKDDVLSRGFPDIRANAHGWHSFRRAFANALRDVPLRELKDLGGWKSELTVVAVYLRLDEQAQRTALTKLAANGQ
jgi:integrase